MMEVLPQNAMSDIMQMNQSKTEEDSFDATDGAIMWDAQAQGVNRKLMRLAVDSRISSKRQSCYTHHEDNAPLVHTNKFDQIEKSSQISMLSITHYSDGQSTRFPRIEEMSHFHYSTVDFGGPVTVQLDIDEFISLDTGQEFLIEVVAKESWTLKRSYEDFVGLDRQLHRCLYDRRYSKLPQLKELELSEGISQGMVRKLKEYLDRFTEVSGNNVNCGPVLNWLELDNHGNHLVVTEADDSAINVPAIAAGRVIKRYQAQAPDEMTLDVGEFLSIIDMPLVEETIWWRGKKGFEVGFFPAHCVQVLGDKHINESIISSLYSRPVIKRRGKFVSFLRFFFKSRPSKDELMQHGILRERMFGCDLGEYLAHTGHNVPLVLQMCSDVVEEYGIVDGIYRLSGIMSNIQKLRVAFDSNAEPPDLKDQKFLNDVHCISSLLKTYFRELPNPLFTYELYTKFVAAINKDDDTGKTVAFHHVIQRLPPPHYRTMNYLLRHLNYCASKAKQTNMTAKNLAIVWAPNLLRPNMDDSVAALTEFRTQAIIVEYMIRNVDVFFDKNLASAAIAYYPELQDTNPLEVATSPASSFSPVMSTIPKLISLEEAQLRVQSNHRKVSVTLSTGSNTSNSPRHKFRPKYEPPKVSATPISPLPTLLSLEEAQARTKPSFTQKASADITDVRNEQTSSPKRNRKWLGLFSRAKSTSPNAKVNASSYTTISSPRLSLSEFNIHDLHSSLDTEKSPSSTSINVPVVVKKSDGDDSSLMSAVESVSKRYGSVSDSVKHMRKAITSADLVRKSKPIEVGVSPERKHSISVTEEIVPVKKTRSLSPVVYADSMPVKDGKQMREEPTHVSSVEKQSQICEWPKKDHLVQRTENISSDNKITSQHGLLHAKVSLGSPCAGTFQAKARSSVLVKSTEERMKRHSRAMSEGKNIVEAHYANINDESNERFITFRSAIEDNRPAQSAIKSNRLSQSVTKKNRPVQSAAENNRPAQSATENNRPAQSATEDTRPAQSAIKNNRPAHSATENNRPVQSAFDLRPSQNGKVFKLAQSGDNSRTTQSNNDHAAVISINKISRTIQNVAISRPSQTSEMLRSVQSSSDIRPVQSSAIIRHAQSSRDVRPAVECNDEEEEEGGRRQRALSVKERAAAINGGNQKELKKTKSTPALDISSPTVSHFNKRHSNYLANRTLSTDQLVTSANHRRKPPVPLPKYVDLRPSRTKLTANKSVASVKLSDHVRSHSDNLQVSGRRSLHVTNISQSIDNSIDTFVSRPFILTSKSVSSRDVADSRRSQVNGHRLSRPHSAHVNSEQHKRYQDLKATHYDMV